MQTVLRNRTQNALQESSMIKCIPIQVKPNYIEFANIEINQKYEMHMHIKNEGKENEKIRLINPKSEYFAIKNETNPFIIAPGLTYKIVVYFHLQGTFDCFNDIYEDRIIINGSSFKVEIPLTATKPNFKLEIPKFYNIGLVQIGKECQFDIGIKNVGKEDVEVGMIKTSSPVIMIEDNKIVIKKESENFLKIKVVKNKPGLIEERISFPNGDSIEIKGVCSEENVEIYGKSGEILKEIHFGNVFVGEKITYPFYIANNSSEQIDGLLKIFNTNLTEFSNIKVDLNKMIFVNRNNPQKAIEEEKFVHGKCKIHKFVVSSFESFENKLIVHQEPTEEELKHYSNEAMMEDDRNNRETWSELTESSETLYIKLINVKQPIKIPFTYCPIVPKIRLSQDKFEFPPTLSKEISKITFKIKNCNDRQITIKLEPKSIFYFEGDFTIKPQEYKEFKLCFRPVIAGEYSEYLNLSLFDTWNINLKAFGQCYSINQSNTNSLSNMEKSSKNRHNSLQTMKTARFLEEERKRRKDMESTLYLKSKITERTKIGFVKDPNLPIDLTFDACENPKVISNKKFAIKLVNSNLFFNADEYAKQLAEKKKEQPLVESRLNLKEIIKLSEELTPEELSKVEVKCDKIDFGSIFIGSLIQKELIISNKNNKIILIELDYNNNECLSKTKSELKKIEPFSEAKFTIQLRPNHLGHLKIPIRYIINKNHIFEMDIIANVTLINLSFSCKQLQFSFEPGDMNFEKLETLTVNNHGSTTTKFVIIEPTNKSFSVLSKKELELMPNEESLIVVKYQPLESFGSGEMRVDHGKMIVKVIGGAENSIKCEGAVYEPKYSIKETEINMREVFISTAYQNKLTIRNQCKVESFFKVDLSPPSLSEVIFLDQKQFFLHPEERKELSFDVLSHDIKVVKGHIIITSRGGKTFKIPIYINFCFPTVEVVGCDEVNFGTVHIMTNHFEREIVLINKTKTEIKLETNKVDDRADYLLEFIASQEKVELALRCTFQETETDEEEVSKDTKKRTIMIEDENANAAKMKNPKKINKIIALAPGVETKFKMRFVPKAAKLYELKIPLILHKAIREIEPIHQKIKCKAVEPLFYIHPFSIKFENVVISDNQHAYKKTFSIINPHDKEVNWSVIESQDANRQLFILEETCGILMPKEQRKVDLYFTPEKEGVYSYRLKMVSSEAPEIEIELEISGSAVSPKIGFNKNLAILPVVPIKTEAKTIIEIENFGYETVNISKIKFSHQFEGVDLKYNFLDGKLLSLAKKKLKVEISFKSEFPVSLTTYLEIYDEFGDKILIPISATADNCVLTTYSYLEMGKNNIILDNTDNILKLQNPSVFTSKNKQTSISGSSTVTGNFIKKWCNYELNIHIQSFPENFVESRGDLLYEIIIKMANGRPIIKKPTFESEEKLSRIHELHAYYSEIIRVLQTEGAFLNHIRPEFLLNMNDYILYMVNNNNILEEEEFECLSHDSWTIIFYQIAKLYFESVVTEKLVQKFSNKIRLEKLTGSYVYSEQELLILEFINEYLGEEKITNLNDQARIFEVIQRIIEKTFKISLGEELAKLKINADSLQLHEFLILVSKFLYSHLQEYGLSMYLEPNDLFTMGHKEFVLFFISLMQNLVHLNSPSIIQFESAQGERNEKIIELENPSKKKKLKYWVKLFGSPNFRTHEKAIEIEPLEKRMLKITYHCKKNADEEAQLLLVPIKDEEYFTNAHSLNFLLKNSLISKTIIKKVNLKSSLYEIKSIFVDIELPIKEESIEYEVKLIGNQFVDELLYPSYYLVNPGMRILKNGRDKCEIKIAALEIEEMSFRVIAVVNTFQEYIYEFNLGIVYPNSSQTFKLDPIIAEKEEKRFLKIPIENELKDQCLKFHKEWNKEKDKKKTLRNDSILSQRNSQMQKIRLPRANYEVEFLEESIFQIENKEVTVGIKEKNEESVINTVEIKCLFEKSFKEYKTEILVKNEDYSDYRVYTLSTSVSIKPKIFHVKISAKARQLSKVVIPNRLSPFTVRMQRSNACLTYDILDSGDVVLKFEPQWVMKEEIDMFLENPDTYEQHTYKIKMDGIFPDPVKMITLQTSQIFSTPFEIDISDLKLKPKEFENLKLVSTITREHDISLKSEGGSHKILGIAYPGDNEKESSIKLFLSPKSEQFYEYFVTFKNQTATKINTIHVVANIEEIKKINIPEIDPSAKDFFYEYQQETYFTHEVSTNDLKTNSSAFNIIFKPSKELKVEKNLKFRTNSKEFELKIFLETKKLEPLTIQPILCENLEKKSTNILISNSYEIEGTYEIIILDESKFTSETKFLDLKPKDKANLKITFNPHFIGDIAKTKIILKSHQFPELTYILEGISKFKLIHLQEEIEGFENIEATKELLFINEFSNKEKFSFKISPSSSSYTFSNNELRIVRELERSESLFFVIKNKCSKVSEDLNKEATITVLREKDKKVVKEYSIKMLLVINLEDKKYTWDCRARETVFESIKLPPSYKLREIRADPKIEKYLSFNIDEKNENEAKVKFAPLKPIKSKVFNILLISDKVKFRIMCTIKVEPPSIDDTITIRTGEIKETGISSFRLTNIIREPAPFKAYFEKNQNELDVETSQGVLEPYGKQGTPIIIKFKSEVHNKKVEDKLIIETNNMYWIFKVIGIQEKKLKF